MYTFVPVRMLSTDLIYVYNINLNITINIICMIYNIIYITIIVNEESIIIYIVYISFTDLVDI